MFNIDTSYGLKRLRKLYGAFDPNAVGPVPVPLLWDGETGQVVSTDHAGIEVDLATEFREWSTTGLELYPPDLREEIDDLDRWVGPAVSQGAYQALGSGGDAGRTRVVLHEAFGRLDRRLASSRYLIGDRLTLADVRLWVTLARHDPPADGRRRIGDDLSQYRSLWAYAQSLYEMEPFQRTTDSAALRRVS